MSGEHPIDGDGDAGRHEDSDTEVHTRPTVGRLIVYFIFAWLVSNVCGLSSTFTASYFLDFESDFSFRAGFFGLLLSVLQFGTGAFVLGTLTFRSVKTWTAVIVYLIPYFLRRGLIFAIEALDYAMNEALSYPGPFIVMPIIYMLVIPFVSFCFLRMGEERADTFSRPHAALNLPWLHWLWVLPFFLFQAVGVPLFLMLWMFIYEDTSFFIFSLPNLIIRVLLFFILVGVVTAINASYTALTEQTNSSGMKILKVFGTWVLLTAMEIFIVLASFGKLMDLTKSP